MSTARTLSRHKLLWLLLPTRPTFRKKKDGDAPSLRKTLPFEACSERLQKRTVIPGFFCHRCLVWLSLCLLLKMNHVIMSNTRYYDSPTALNNLSSFFLRQVSVFERLE